MSNIFFYFNQIYFDLQVWTSLQNGWPHFLGPDNPKNREIKRLFGDQGGHWLIIFSTPPRYFGENIVWTWEREINQTLDGTLFESRDQKGFLVTRMEMICFLFCFAWYFCWHKTIFELVRNKPNPKTTFALALQGDGKLRLKPRLRPVTESVHEQCLLNIHLSKLNLACLVDVRWAGFSCKHWKRGWCILDKVIKHEQENQTSVSAPKLCSDQRQMHKCPKVQRCLLSCQEQTQLLQGKRAKVVWQQTWRCCLGQIQLNSRKRMWYMAPQSW